MGGYGASLKPEYYPVWALYFSKYIKAYQAQGIPIWGVTVETAAGQRRTVGEHDFYASNGGRVVKENLAPQFKKDGLDVKILIYDQNRDELEKWASMLDDPGLADVVWDTAVTGTAAR